ncbi:GNAT family N-acetyltransferase [Terracidiphilus gabretensis]|uniref:GNAT family N-acetyltransferase n=1 Tax=Terracidiphilus gabretensis TaxID=1577687 RepID=UPI00071B9F57|nr:GNAT family N-acetyltransferase [Terracidiphilus gabretensis]
MEIRMANAEDARLIAGHRRAMFAAMGAADEADLATVESASIPWTERMILESRYLGWITSDGKRPVASAGMFLLDWPPHPLDPEGTVRGYLLNVFVEPAHRERGLARELVQICLAEAKRRGIRVVTLHASDEGRPLYETLGFSMTNEMRLTLANE